jgi:hypothetical protein
LSILSIDAEAGEALFHLPLFSCFGNRVLAVERGGSPGFSLLENHGPEQYQHPAFIGVRFAHPLSGCDSYCL